jgi:putative redox protein
MPRITVTHRHDESFDVRVRGCALISDEPVTYGGDDEGPTPTELMVAGLAACAAEEAVRCMAALGEAFMATEVGADFAWDREQQRVDSVQLTVTLPDGISENARVAVTAAVLACPARKMLTQPPTVEYDFHESPKTAAVAASRNGWPREASPDADSEA